MSESKGRAGETVTTSVSVSREFAKLIKQYNLSPTECFRRGVAVTLFDLGVGMYQSQKNEDRFKFVQEFLKKAETDEKLREDYEKIKLYQEIKKHIIKIRKISDELEEN